MTNALSNPDTEGQKQARTLVLVGALAAITGVLAWHAANTLWAGRRPDELDSTAFLRVVVATMLLPTAAVVLIGVGQGMVLLGLLRWWVMPRNRGPWQLTMAGLAALVSLTVVTQGVTMAEAEAAAGGRWAGYSIKTTKYADSSWIGGRSMGGQHVYRLEPRKLNVKSKYRPAVPVSDLNGSAAKPSARNTSVAACVLATYGNLKDRIQAAAVDAVTYHLLRGGKWRISKARGAARIRQAGQSKYVRSYAKSMLAACAKTAGPYRVSMTSTTAAVGSATRVTYTIKSASGLGLANVPVTFSYGGATPVEYTNSEGTATANFDVTQSGITTATARADRVPEWRLLVRAPKNKRASAVAVAGRLTAIASSTSVRASGSQSVSVANAASALRVGQLLGGSYTIAGGSGTRSVTRSYYGPFDTSASNCSSPRPYTSSTSTSTNGRYSLPSWLPPKSGYYRAGVAVGGNDLSTAASTCGTPVRVIKQAAIAQDRPAGRSRQVKIGEGFNVTVKVSGFDRAEGHTVVSRLYGPFASKDNARCTEAKRVASKNQSRNVSGNGDYTMGKAVITAKANTGWYVWQTTLSSGDLIAGGTSSCGVLYEVVR